MKVDMIDEDYRFYKNLERQKEEEKDWVKKRREDYYERQKRIEQNPPDEDAWNK